MSRPDAVIVPRSAVGGGDDDARKESVLDLAEPLLELGPYELAWCHDQVGYFFCTRRAEDTELHPGGHPESGRPRYRWDARPDGVKLGYIIAQVD